MTSTIQLGDIAVDVTQKDIKNVHLSVYPPTGAVRVSAPQHMSLDTIRSFTISKLGWIKQERKKLREQARETPREFINRESHYVWGQRYLLKVVERDAVPSMALKPRHLVLHIRPSSSVEKRASVVAQWHRDQVKVAATNLIAKWEPLMGVKVARLFVQQMKTKWGSCNPDAGNIRLNSELAKKPPECLEYIVVHEMAHLLEPRHGQRFKSLMDRFMPAWRHQRDELNRRPLSYESWEY